MNNASKIKKEKHSSFSKFLNKYFHQIDRGSNLRTEVLTGIVVFLITICLLFVNMQVVGKYILGDLVVSTSPQDAASIEACKTYVSLYQGSLIISLVSSVLIGLIARLPFVELSMMGLSSSFIGLLCANNGLSYQNLLFLSFLSSVLFAILSGIPFLRKKIISSIPKPLLHILPLASGFLLILMGAALSGFFNINAIATGSLGKEVSFFYLSPKQLEGIPLFAFISVIVGFVVYLVLKANRSKHPFSFSFLVTFGLFMLFSIFGLLANNFSTTKADSYINFGRIWLIMGSQSSPVTPFGDSYLTYAFSGFGELFKNFSTVFTKGCDFSAYTGNVFLLVLSCILSCVLFQFVDPLIVLECSKEEDQQTDNEEDKDIQKLYWINSAMNIVAPFFFAGSVTTSKTSLIAAKDKAKSGIVPLVSSIGYLISLFILAFPALLATDTYVINSMNEFNYFAYGNGGLIYLIQGASFGIADAFLVLVGAIMIEKSVSLLKEDEKEMLPVIGLFLIGLLFKGLVLGFTFSLAYILLINLFKEDDKTNENKNFFVRGFLNLKKNIKTVSIPTLCLFAYCLIAACL